MKFALRVLALSAVAAGVGVVYMATREDGREQLAKFGETLNDGFKAMNEYIASFRLEEPTEVVYRQQATASYSGSTHKESAATR
jgi:hypothetical protein